jgi:glucokinase
MYVSLDIGGTTTRIAFSKNFADFIDVIKYPTPDDFNEFVNELNNHLLSSSEEIKAISLGIAGIINRKKQHILKCPNIPFIENLSPFDLIHDVKRTNQIQTRNLTLSKTKIYLENDASLAALAEATVGPGKSYKRVAYITASTGIGGSLITDKEIAQTTYNLEPGHHFINYSQTFGRTWEDIASGTSFTKRFGIKPDNTNDQNIWNHYVNYFASGLHNISLLWRPDIIIIGGSIAKKSDYFLVKLQEKLNETLGETRPEIKISGLGDDNGLIGGFINLTSIIR